MDDHSDAAGCTPYADRHVQRTVSVLVLTVVIWLSAVSAVDRHNRPEDLPTIPPGSPLIQIELNTADDRELSLLPGVGPVLARRIVSDRACRGPFLNIEDLTRVRGIGVKRIQDLKTICVVEIP